MQLDLQSVGKVPFSSFTTRKMLAIGLHRLRISRSFLQHVSRAVSRFSRGPAAGNHRQHYFDPTGLNTIRARVNEESFQIESIQIDFFY